MRGSDFDGAFRFMGYALVLIALALVGLGFLIGRWLA